MAKSAKIQDDYSVIIVFVVVVTLPFWHQNFDFGDGNIIAIDKAGLPTKTLNNLL